jgi:phage terminase large subunit-like protein
MHQQQSQSSLAELFRSLPYQEQTRRIDLLTDEEAEALLYDWDFNARPKQKLPTGLWQYWLILAGRGFGKTRTGAETVREWVKKYPIVNLIGATTDDARDIMIEGESGILAICPNNERPTYLGHKRQLVWPNGAKSLVFTADEPERLRGKQHMKLWADELAAWRYPESWDQAMLGLRLGDNPQAIVTTTPKPTKLVKELAADKNTVVTTGSTYENQSNLAPTFLATTPIFAGGATCLIDTQLPGIVRTNLHVSVRICGVSWSVFVTGTSGERSVHPAMVRLVSVASNRPPSTGDCGPACSGGRRPLWP